MRAKTVFIIFAGVCLVQVLIPLSIIIRHELILKNGQVYKFKTASVDPYDPFRGKYVRLRIAGRAKCPGTNVFYKHQKIYVTITNDYKGFAHFSQAFADKPDGTAAYLKTEVKSTWGRTAEIYIPFTKYYLDENFAQEAEKSYTVASRRDKRRAYIAVRILSGSAVLEELYLEDTPVMEYLKKLSKTAK